MASPAPKYKPWVWLQENAYYVFAPLVALLVVAVFEQTQISQVFEHYLLNIQYRLRAPWDKPADPRLLFVGIDEPSLENFGSWPWPRRVEADFFKLLAASGTNPRVVACDILFSEDSDPLHLLKNVNGLTADQDLAQAINALPCAITASYFVKEGVADEAEDMTAKKKQKVHEILSEKIDKNLTQPLTHIQGNLANLEGSDIAQFPYADLRKGGYFGFANDFKPLYDGLRYDIPMVVRIQDKVYPSLSLQMLCQALSVDPDNVEIVLGDHIRVHNNFGKSWQFPINDRGLYHLNYRHNDSFNSMSFYWLTADLNAYVEKKEPLLPQADLRKKIVLIGQSAIGLTDLGPNPYSGNSPQPLLHLVALNNILQGDYMTVVPEKWIVLGWSLLTWGLAFLLRRASLTLTVIMPSLVLAVYVVGSTLIFTKWSIQVPLFWPVVSYIGVNFGSIVIRWLQDQRGRREMRRLFSTVTSHRMLALLEEHPEAYYNHRKVKATMMFSDVAGFTSVSEKLDPPYLAGLMNRYLSPMSEIIIEHDGYVNQYLGDGIMAIWGALFPDPEHEYKACAAGWKQLQRAREIPETLPDGRIWHFYIRIGINTGMVSAGNLGSTQKKQFTVMGDEVNLTARLEPTNKDYGSQIILGPQTYEAVKDRVWTRPLDKIIVTGRTEGVTIYELLGLRELDPVGPGEWIGLYTEGLYRLWARDWDSAQDFFARADGTREGGDAASRLQTARVEQYRKSPPPTDWQGDYMRLKKD